MTRRTHITPNQTFRAVHNDNGGHTITGYAALFHVLSNELAPGVRERIAVGAFDSALQRADLDCTANWNHDDQLLLGRTSAGTLKLSTDDIGLRFEVTLPDTSYARDLGELMKLGNIRECSFAFTVDPANIDVERVSDTEVVETIRSVEQLFDTAIVTRGAYSQTFAAFRNADPFTDLGNSFRQLAEVISKNHPIEPLESRTAESGEANPKSESHPANDFDFDIALAELDLHQNLTLILGS